MAVRYFARHQHLHLHREAQPAKRSRAFCCARCRCAGDVGDYAGELRHGAEKSQGAHAVTGDAATVGHLIQVMPLTEVAGQHYGEFAARWSELVDNRQQRSVDRGACSRRRLGWSPTTSANFIGSRAWPWRTGLRERWPSCDRAGTLSAFADAAGKTRSHESVKAHSAAITPRIAAGDVAVGGLPDDLARAEVHVAVLVSFSLWPRATSSLVNVGGRPWFEVHFSPLLGTGNAVHRAQPAGSRRSRSFGLPFAGGPAAACGRPSRRTRSAAGRLSG